MKIDQHDRMTFFVPRFCQMTFHIFSWEPALETLNSQEAAEAAVKKKALQFSGINSDF